MSGVELSPLTHLGEVGRAAGRSGGGDGAALPVEPLASLRRQAVERIRIGGQHEWAIECEYVVLGVGHVDGIGNGLLDGREPPDRRSPRTVCATPARRRTPHC